MSFIDEINALEKIEFNEDYIIRKGSLPIIN